MQSSNALYVIDGDLCLQLPVREVWNLGRKVLPNRLRT